MQTVEYLLPSFLASYLINDDSSSLEDNEVELIDSWLKSNHVGVCCDVEESSSYSSNHELYPDILACESSMFTFLTMKDDETGA